MNRIMIVLLTMATSACGAQVDGNLAQSPVCPNGQYLANDNTCHKDQPAETVKPIDKVVPAMEHIYTCPAGYELSYYARGNAEYTGTEGIFPETYSLYEPMGVTESRDIVRSRPPVCVRKKPMVKPALSLKKSMPATLDWISGDTITSASSLNVAPDEITFGTPVSFFTAGGKLVLVAKCDAKGGKLVNCVIEKGYTLDDVLNVLAAEIMQRWVR